MKGDDEDRAGEQIPALDEVLRYPDGQRTDDRRWIVLYPEDYENVAIDVDDNVGICVDIEQAGELLRLAAQTLASLSHRDADGEDVIRDLIWALEQEVGEE